MITKLKFNLNSKPGSRHNKIQDVNVNTNSNTYEKKTTGSRKNSQQK